jgi:DNA-binding transcriptional ArsR family regulator
MSPALSPIPQFQIVRDASKAAVFLQPARLRILQQLASAPDSGSGVAKALEMPRQLANYHLRELEKEGFVDFVAERRRGNCMERIVRASAASYLVSPEALGALGGTPEQQRDRFSLSHLIGAAARIIRDLATLSIGATKANKRLATLTLETEVRFRNPAERNAFAEELADKLADLTAKYHDPFAAGGRSFRILAAAYPAITKSQEQEDHGGESAIIH